MSKIEWCSLVVERGSPMSSLRTPGSRLTLRFVAEDDLVMCEWTKKKSHCICHFFFLYSILKIALQSFKVKSQHIKVFRRMKRVFLIFQPISSVRRELVWFRPVKSTHSFHFRSTPAMHDVFPGGGQNIDPSPWTCPHGLPTHMDYPRMDYATEA